MIPNLGKAISVLARAEARELDYHADVDAYGAPSECHGLVAKGEARRARMARRHAEAIARRPIRVIEREAARRGCPINLNCRAYGRLVSAFVSHPYLTGEAEAQRRELGTRTFRL